MCAIIGTWFIVIRRWWELMSTRCALCCRVMLAASAAERQARVHLATRLISRVAVRPWLLYVLLPFLDDVRASRIHASISVHPFTDTMVGRVATRWTASLFIPPPFWWFPTPIEIISAPFVVDDWCPVCAGRHLRVNGSYTPSGIWYSFSTKN